MSIEQQFNAYQQPAFAHCSFIQADNVLLTADGKVKLTGTSITARLLTVTYCANHAKITAKLACFLSASRLRLEQENECFTC